MSDKTFLVRLSDEEHQALQDLATAEHRSMQDVARLAIAERASRSRRHDEVHDALSEIMDRDSELLRRLAQ